MISLAILEDLAGTAAFQRGEEYFSMGAVRRLQATKDKATAKVDGSETYLVELRDDDGELAYDCTCPRAADGYFCKHCVAVGLAWLADQAGEIKIKKKGDKAKRRDPWRDIRNHLIAQPQEILIDLLLEVAHRDDRLYRSSSSGPNAQVIPIMWSRRIKLRSMTRRIFTIMSIGARRAHSPKISSRLWSLLRNF